MPSHQRSIFVYLSLGLAIAVGAIFLALSYPDAPVLHAAGVVRKIVIPFGLCIGIVLLLVQVSVVYQWRAVSAALKRAESRADAAESEARAKSNFLATVSHELRTSLTAINGYADVLTQHMFGPLGSPKYEEYAAGIRSGGEALLNITNDLLQISKMGVAEGEFTLEPIDIGTCTGKVVAQLHPEAADKNVMLKIDVLPRPIWGYAQKEAVRQALIRIIGNAIKFTDEGGLIVVGVSPEKGHVDITVTDNGCGIPQDKLARLGEGFMPGDTAMAGKAEGLGLGLVISRRLVERMNGTLIVESIVGRGTRVTIRLNDAEAEAAPKDDGGRSGVIERDLFRAAGKVNPFRANAA